MRNFYNSIQFLLCFCIYNIASGQAPAFQLASAISYTNPITLQSYETVSATVKNIGATGTFDFECDLLNTSNGFISVIGKYCGITVNANATAAIYFNSSSIDAHAINPSGGAGTYRINIIACSIVSGTCPGCGTKTSSCIANVAPGSYANQVALTVNQACTAVTMNIQPQGQTVNSGNTASFSVSVNGTPPFSYFWYKNGVFQTNTTNTSSSSNTYITPALTNNDNGSYYYCLISNCNSTQQVQSANANLIVTSAVGFVNVTILPSGAVSAGATWNLDGNGNYASGAILSNIATGSHTIGFNNTANGWTPPGNQTINVTTGNTASASGTYTQNTVNYTISTSSSPLNSGTTSGDGTYPNGTQVIVTATPNSGYSFVNWTENGNSISASSNFQFTVSGNRNLVANFVQATQFGSVNVTINPSGVISAGAQWNLDGGSWQNSGTTLNNITTGNHTLNFKTVSAWTSPLSQNINVTNGNTYNATGTYTQNSQYGSVNVTLSPSGAVSAGATWNLDGAGTYTSGYTLPNISTGSHIIGFNSATGWIPPANQTINVTTGNASTVTGTYIQNTNASTVKITYPTGGETWTMGNTYSITANITRGITGNIITNLFDISYDGGATWDFIGGISSAITSLSYMWKPINRSSIACKIRIRTLDPSGNLSDVSNSNFSIVAPSNGLEFSLTTDPARLFWPFANSNWDNDPNSIMRDSWRGGEEPHGHGSGHGGGHTGCQYYASDWNRVYNQPTYYSLPDVDYDFKAPLSGIVINSYSVCPANYTDSPSCLISGISSCKPGQGTYHSNHVVIKADKDPTFAFEVMHLNYVSVSTGDHVNFGQVIGKVGATGKSCGSHAHCVLYRNINLPYVNGFTAEQWLSQPGQSHSLASGGVSPNPDFAANFIFNAISGGIGGPGNQDLVSINGSRTLCPNDSIIITAKNGIEYFWNTGKTTQSIVVRTPGAYSVLITDSLGNQNLSQIINVYTAPIISPGANEWFTLCNGSSIQIYPSIAGMDSLSEINQEEGLTFQWSNGKTTPSLNVSQGGLYIVTVTNLFQKCYNTFTDTLHVTVVNPPLQPTVQVNGTTLACNTSNGVAYQWNFNGLPLYNDTLQITNAKSNGYYTVTIFDKVTGCSSTSIPLYVGVTGIESNAGSNTLRIFPNPARNEFNIEFDLTISHKEISFTLFNSIGQTEIFYKVFNSSPGMFKTIMNIQNLRNGIYQLQIKLDDGTILNKKVVIQK